MISPNSFTSNSNCNERIHKENISIRHNRYFASGGGVEIKLYNTPNEWSYKRDYMERHSDRIKTLLVGASNAANGIDPAAIGDSCFNLAVNAQMLCITRATCEKFLPACNHVKNVVLPIAYNLFYEGYTYPLSKNDIIAQMKASDKCKYFKYMGVKETPKDWLYWPETIWLKSETIGRLFGKDENGIGCDSLGFEHNTLSTRGDTWKSVHVPGEIKDELGNANLAFADNVQNTRKIARLCKERGAQLILLSTPYYETAQKVTSAKRRKAVQHFVDEVRKGGYDNVVYKEYTFDPRFDENDFYNASHLNEVGAAKFGKILRQDFDL